MEINLDKPIIVLDIEATGDQINNGDKNDILQGSEYIQELIEY